MTLTAALRTLVKALIAALALAFAWTAQAQTVTNTAQAAWTQDGANRSVRSNTVSFDVIRRSSAVIDVLHVVPGAAQTITLNPLQCGSRSLPLVGGAAQGGAISVEPAGAVRTGEAVIIRVTAPAANIDVAAIDTITVTVTTSLGDSELVTVSETGANTGIFIGPMPTSIAPAAPVQGDCRLSVAPGATIAVSYRDSASGAVVNSSPISVLADPYGLVFDSEDGTPIDGATVTIVDSLTGAPSQIFADDGVTPWPSTVITGAAVRDGAGNTYQLLPGEYRFPLAALGSYRIKVTPPAPYSAPSKATAAQLAMLARPDGDPLQIVAASFGGSFALASLAPVRIDVPLDRPALSISLSKTVSRARAQPGDAVVYTVRATNTDPTRAKRQVTLTDTPSKWLRLRPDSIRVDGAVAQNAVTFAADGSSLKIALGDVAAGATRTVTYAMSVREDAPAGQALNRAEAVDSRGLASMASAVLKIDRETIAGRMTIIGRITDGGCAADGAHNGIPGVRVMLEDGSFAVTDTDGRYHFEGVVPGTHVVQAVAETLPADATLADCARSTRSAGKAHSRFVTGNGGSLAVVDFAADLPPGAVTTYTPTTSAPVSDRAAAGGEADWLNVADGPTEFLFPAADHNPRAPAIRVVIRHRLGQTVELTVNGRPVDAMTYDGALPSPQGFAVSVWRGIPLTGETTRFNATVRNADGSVSDSLTRDVAFAQTPARAELVAARSRLVADGSSRPVVAVRMVDRLGRPVHAGLTGGLVINAPYESAAQLDALQARQLSGLDRAAPTWTVQGDDGVALIELTPTMVSGPLHLTFTFADDQVSRTQELQAWVVPGEQKWTLVGLAEGTAGARSVASNMERGNQFDSDLGTDARLAFYAKGRVLGRYLLTMAYDSAKQKDDQRLLGTIDPNAYYTVFADGSDRRFDAASREKLYVRIEGQTFYALYGDFVTGFDQTLLARYQRTMTGAKAEGQFGAVHVQGFAAKSGLLHRRDEIQGGGISGPYRLSSRDLVANSETVTLEVRDRFRSELVVSSRTLTRFVDYDIDLLAGTISFREPILSRDALLNPQFIVIDYDLDQARGGEINAGVRADVTTANGKLRIGASAISDTASADGARTNVAALDLKARIGADTEVRAEAAISRTAGDAAGAWLAEIEHHDGNFDALGYVRSVDDGFGLAQINGAERGRRKVGVDGRYRVSDQLSVVASAWYDDSLVDSSHRRAVEVNGVYRTADTDLRLGIANFADQLSDGTRASSTVLEGAVTRRLFDNRLELTGAASIALGKAESIDLPARYKVGARYAVTPWAKLIGSYEIAKGEAVKARTARAGIELSPWEGARILGSLGQQGITDYGKRSFAAFGLSQSLQVSPELTLDATVDAARTLGRFDAAALINPAQPASSGGLLGDAGTLTEDFTAVSVGGTWRRDLWTATARGEYRDGQFANRTGFTFGAIRQLGNGSVAGAGFTWTRAEGNGTSSEIFDGALSAAFRPEGSAVAFLSKIEFRSDSVTGAVAGETGPAGRTALTVDGDAQSRRLIGSFSANWSPKDEGDGRYAQRSELALFAAVRHNFDRIEEFDIVGTSLLGGLDARIGLGRHFEIGGQGTVRYNLSDHTTVFAIGPQIGIVPAEDVLFTIGYNVSGFRDRDFAASRNTDQGLFASVKLKFDADTLGLIGLGRK